MRNLDRMNWVEYRGWFWCLIRRGCHRGSISGDDHVYGDLNIFSPINRPGPLFAIFVLDAAYVKKLRKTFSTEEGKKRQFQ